MATPAARAHAGHAAPVARRVASDEAEVIDTVRAACATGSPLRIAGGGTWLDAGRPVSAALVLDVSRLRGILEYVPGDLTLTARAGTTLGEIEAVAATHRQWLSLEPFGAPGATLGATLATASAGPLAASYGLPRDVALGVAFVTGEGTLVRGGGRVVKNVAGYDLVRMTVGAWGTLGVIVEATVRLRARPEVDETVAVAVPNDIEGLSALLAAVREAPLMPIAAELVSSGMSRRLGLLARDALLLRLAGNAEAVRAQRSAVARLVSATGAPSVDAAPADVWERLRSSEPADAVVVRLSRLPSELPRLWSLASRLSAGLDGVAHATVSRGVVRCWVTADESAIAGALQVEPAVTRIFERLPAALWPSLSPSPVDDALSRRVRAAFDPARILNPGIFGEGAR